MEFFSSLALILLTMVGYSSGFALMGRRKVVQSTFWDLIIIAALWFLAFALRPELGRWLAILAALLVALVTGWAVAAIRGRGVPSAPPVSELPEHARERPPQSTNPFRRAWEAWSVFALEMGNVQGRLLMGFFYFFIVTPFGLASRLFSDPLHLQERPADSGWREKEPLDNTLEQARQQG